MHVSKFRLVLLVATIILANTLPLAAAQISHIFNGYGASTYLDTTSTSFVDAHATDTKLTGFTIGKKYLLYNTSTVFRDTSTAVAARIVHGSTEFVGSVGAFRGSGSATTNRGAYCFPTVWTSVTGEDVKYQHRTTSAGTAHSNYVQMFAMNLSDDLSEDTGSGGDWKSNENTTTTAMTTALADGASITFTPLSAGQTWLVLAGITIDYTNTTNGASILIDRSGEATSSTPNPSMVVSATDRDPAICMSRSFTLGAASNTFKVRYASVTANAHNHTRSFIIAINLTKFRNKATSFAAGPVAVGVTDYATNIGSVSITPDVTGPVWMGGTFTYDTNIDSTILNLEYALQIDSTDQPTGQTSNNDQYHYQSIAVAAQQEAAYGFSSYNASVSSGSAHEVKIAASTSSSGPEAKDISVWAVTMELAPAGGGGCTGRMLLLHAGKC